MTATLPASQPVGQLVMGFDFGYQRIGIAVLQTLTGQARALLTLGAVSGKPDWPRILSTIAEWSPQTLVVGLPLNADGTDHDVTRSARKFGNRLVHETRLPVVWTDERLSSREAGERLRRRGGSADRRDNPLDAEAACVILETWLAEQPPVETSL